MAESIAPGACSIPQQMRMLINSTSPTTAAASQQTVACLKFSRKAEKNFSVTPEYSSETDKGPDQYAGQAFCDPKGRQILLAWVPGWKYKGYAARDVGCMSLPRELKLQKGRITGYPIREVAHLLQDSDPALERTEEGFVIHRTGRDPVVYKGEIRELKLLRDGYILEVFINGGEEVFTALL